jgi:hypothetical protein
LPDLQYLYTKRSIRLGLHASGLQSLLLGELSHNGAPFLLSESSRLDTLGTKPHHLVFLDPKEPKKKFNMFLRPLFEELKELWQGAHAYDSHLKC